MNTTNNTESPNHKTLFSDPALSVYAILDGASIPELLSRFSRFKAEHICLYRGEQTADMAKVSPYLVALPAESELTDWILSLIGTHPGIFARTPASMREMRQHLRKFLMVYDATSNPVYFRYYDPRVLNTYLATCDKEKEKTLFGPITHFFAENEAGDQLISYIPQQSSVTSKGMLTLSPLQIAGFQQHAEYQFIKKIQQEFSEKYPQIFSAFPEKIQTNIISNLFDRAKYWGISWKSSLVTFAELMLVIAPNFDQQSDINEVLNRNKEQNNQTIKSITEQVPDNAWTQAEAATEDLPLYLSADSINAHLEQQTAKAIALVLWDKTAERDIQQTAENACRYADELG